MNVASGTKNLQIYSDHVTATGLCSCGQGSYAYQTSSFQNYCPVCGCHGTLKFEQIMGSDPGSCCPEGMWYCTNCDADFCLVHGKKHIVGSNVYLTSYTPPQPKTRIEQQRT
jgi:hypothetical protein